MRVDVLRPSDLFLKRTRRRLKRCFTPAKFANDDRRVGDCVGLHAPRNRIETGQSARGNCR